MLGYSIPQFLPRPEMDHGLGFHVHSSASFRVSLHGRRMVAQGEGREAADLDTLASAERLGHLIDQRSSGLVDLVLGQMGKNGR